MQAKQTQARQMFIRRCRFYDVRYSHVDEFYVAAEDDCSLAASAVDNGLKMLNLR